MTKLLKLPRRKASQQRSRGFMLAVGALGVAALLVIVTIGFNAPNAIPGRGYYTVQAEFDRADNLTKHSQVRHNGKLIGQVLNLRVEHGKAVVDLQMNPDDGPLLSDTRLEVRPRSPVGVRYVDIVDGRRGRPLRDGERIPATQTKATRPLDEVLSTLDPATRERTQSFLREFGKGFAGRGEDLSQALGGAPRFLGDTDAVLGTVADRRGAMRSLIRGGATVAGAADPVREVIRRGFAPEARALRPFSDAGDALKETLDVAPGALATVRSGLTTTDPFVRELRGFARAVRPALDAAPGSLAQTSALLRESRPGLRAGTATLRTAAHAVSPTLDLLANVRPLLPELDGTLAAATPLVTKLGAHGCDIVKFGSYWSSMMSYGDADLGNTGGVLRFNVISPGPQSVYGATSRQSFAYPENPYPAPCVAGNEAGR